MMQGEISAPSICIELRLDASSLLSITIELMRLMSRAWEMAGCAATRA